MRSTFDIAYAHQPGPGHAVRRRHMFIDYGSYCATGKLWLQPSSEVTYLQSPVWCGLDLTRARTGTLPNHLGRPPRRPVSCGAATPTMRW